jgi:hypothetical protein
MKYRYEDIRTFGPWDFWTFGLLDIGTFGLLDIRSLGLLDCKSFHLLLSYCLNVFTSKCLIGHWDFWTLGHSDIRMQMPGKRPFDTSFGLLRDRFNLKKYTSSAVPESAEADRRAHP